MSKIKKIKKFIKGAAKKLARPFRKAKADQLKDLKDIGKFGGRSPRESVRFARSEYKNIKKELSDVKKGFAILGGGAGALVGSGYALGRRSNRKKKTKTKTRRRRR